MEAGHETVNNGRSTADVPRRQDLERDDERGDYEATRECARRAGEDGLRRTNCRNVRHQMGNDEWSMGYAPHSQILARGRTPGGADQDVLSERGGRWQMMNGKRAEEVDRLDRVRPGEGEGDDI